MVRTLFAGLLLALTTGAAHAQVTTYIAPPRTDRPTPQTIAADSARRDSLVAVAITDMKTWVDSAAGVTVPATANDTAGLPADQDRPVTVTADGRTSRTTTFADGMVAPNTASVLPAVALFGAAVFIVGAALLASRPRG